MLVFFLLLTLAAGGLSALDWPVDGAALSANFGSDSAGLPLAGDCFSVPAGSGLAVRAAGAGEVVFARDERERASRLPAPLGSWVACDHGDSLLGVYGRLDEAAPGEGQPFDTLPRKVTAETVLGRTGKSGWSAGEGFYFAFFDRKERRWVNPSRLLTPQPDVRPPRIETVLLVPEAGGEAVNLAWTRTLPQGRYVICVQAQDTRLDGGEKPLAPFRVESSVNGVEAGRLVFETLQSRDGTLLAYRNGLVSARAIYAHAPALEAGEAVLSRGQAMLDLVVSDISGWTAAASWRLFVE